MSYGDAKEQVRQATDIVELVGKHLDLRRAGRNFVGRCPWHDDRRPSLQVNPDRQTWKCWVCDIGGDAFSFVMKREGCDFAEALKMLADRAGIQIGPQQQKKAAPGSPDDKNTLYQCCDWAARQFHEFLLNADGAAEARQYVEDRNITPASVERFKIGFAPDDWGWLQNRARQTPYSLEVLKACDLIGKSERGYYDRFKGRLIFPIRDTQGRTIAFGGRVLPSNTDPRAGKYVNSTETRLYTKSQTLYALDLAREQVTKSRQLTIVEGYTDVVLCHQHGVSDVIACCGTAVTDNHIRLLKRFADTVYLVLDGDKAGQDKTNALLELFVAAQMDLRIMTLPDELDPAEFMEERGGEAFRGLLATAIDALEHKIRTSTRGIDLARDTHRANLALEEILATIARGLPASGIDATSLRAQQLFARLAREFALEIGDVRSRFSQLCRSNNRKAETSPVDEEMPAPAVATLGSLPAAEVELLRILAAHPEFAPTALTEIAGDDFQSPSAREIFQIYRRMEESGESLEFGAVLAEIEDPQMKNLLVGIDEDEARRQERSERRKEAVTDVATRLRDTIKVFHRTHIDHERRQLESAFEQEQEGNLFDQIVNAKRRQQGISLPTDG